MATALGTQVRTCNVYLRELVQRDGCWRLGWLELDSPREGDSRLEVKFEAVRLDLARELGNDRA